MSGNTNFPTGLDDDASLFSVTDGSDTISASHHNNLKEALKAVEAKIGIFNSGAATALDYRLGHASFGHAHNGASGQGGPISASSILGIASALSDPALVTSRFRLQSQAAGAFDVAATLSLPPIYVDRTARIESVVVAANRGPSGGTSAFDVSFGPTSLWYASQGNRPMFFATAGFARATLATVNIVTIPSGTILTVDIDTVGANKGVKDPSITFVFRE